MFSTLRELDDRMLAMENEFGKSFASLFHNQISNLQHHLTNVLQTDVNKKHMGVDEKVLLLAGELERLK
jgi:hypothetical protein